MGTKHIFPNYCCDAEDPLLCVVQNSELLHTYAHAGALRVRKCFPRVFCACIEQGKTTNQNLRTAVSFLRVTVLLGSIADTL